MRLTILFLLATSLLAAEKKTVGTIKDLQAGDVACYVSLVDDAGVAFDEMADFEICEQSSLVGKRVQLKYEMADVMSDECQGNPDCTKTKRVSIITAATPIVGSATLCTASEAVVFSCATGAKLASVCASKDAAPKRGYVQYRFGKPGAIELTLPPKKAVPPDSATGGAGTWLRFHNATYSYVVYTTGTGSGVVVERSGKVASTLKCTGKVLSALSMQWLNAAGIAAGGETFAAPR